MLPLAVGEIMLRLTWDRPGAPHIRFEFWKYLENDPELVYRPIPNILVEYPRYGASFRINRHGFRGPEIPQMRQPDRRRVLVLGDSFAFGHGVGEGQCFAEVLAELLPGTEVVNLGVPGYNVRTELRYFERVGAAWRPDVVVLALCQNDIVDHGDDPASTEGDGSDATPRREGPSPVEASAAPASLKRMLSEHCRLYALGQEVVNANKGLARVAVQLGLKDELGGFEMLDNNLRASLTDPPLSVVRALEQVEADLLRVHKAAAASGAQLVVALIPSLQAVEPAALVRSLAYTKYETTDFDLNRPYERLTRFAARNGVALLNPLETFRTAAASGTPLYLPGDLHFNAEGHWLLAEALRPVVEEALAGAVVAGGGTPAGPRGPRP